jgi:hypothetical protein
MEPLPEAQHAWQAVVDAGEPLLALAAIPALRDALTKWEAALARAALGDGASWTTVGQALGTSRQAAWERLRPAIAAAIEADRQQIEEQRRHTAKRGRTNP